MTLTLMAQTDPMTVSLVAAPVHGSVAVHPTTGVITYTPATNFHGADSFSYTVRDDRGAISNVATVAIDVGAVNDAPVARPDSFTVNQGGALTVAGPGVLANDSDIDSAVLSARLVSGPAHGAVTVSGSGGFTYTPSPGFSGSDSFIYQASDDASASTPAMVTINVSAISASISGRVFTDVTGNGLSADDTTLGGVMVKLYRDANLTGNWTLAPTNL